MRRPSNKSFGTWCEENNLTYMIDLWDNKLNKCSPYDIAMSTAHKYYFKCNRGIHESELTSICNITGEKHYRVHCRKCNSFGQWCIDNSKQELLNRWDKKLNNLDPFDVPYGSGKKYWFTCPVNNPNHPSEQKMLSNVVRQSGSQRCLGCESFGQWCIDNVDKDFMTKYWSDKNTINPFTFTFRSDRKVYIKCHKTSYHDDYLISCANFVKGKRCSYCTPKGPTKVHKFDSVGYKFPDIFKIWSSKNKYTPYNYTFRSNKKVLFDCPKHGEYERKICDMYSSYFKCPMCVQEESASKLQYKVNLYLESLGYKPLHEHNCNLLPRNPLTNAILPYDNEIPELKLIIEVNGMQHYEISQFTVLSSMSSGKTPEECLQYQGEKDDYKRQYAIEHGYYFLEIPYFLDIASEPYKYAIDIAIDQCKEKIRNSKISTVTTAGCM